MSAANPARNLPAEVWMLGRIPPPVTGMTLFTQQVLSRLQSLGPVVFVNWSVGATRRTLLTRLRYVARSFGSALRLLACGRVQGRRLFLVANSQAGLYSTAALAFVASRLGYSVYLHHHVYSYINNFDRRMACIDRWIGTRGVHVVHCQKMVDDFRRRYQSRCAFAIVYPSAVTIELGAPRQVPPSPLRLGMLSNLTMSKGVGDAIDTFTALVASGRQVTLSLAGPTYDPVAKQRIDQAVAGNPGAVKHLGAVYGDDKARFFAEIDVLLFPTQYEHESWGIVLNEALAAGVPLITNDRGCSSIVVGERAGLVVADPAQFVASATRQIERWLDCPREYREASEAAIEQADFLNREGQRTLSEFAEHMFSPPHTVAGLLQP